jgi:hypothetical protein
MGVGKVIMQATTLLSSVRRSQETMVSYVGLTVEVIERMEHYSLIRYRNRKLVVSTEDLMDCRAGKRPLCVAASTSAAGR